MTNLQLGRYHPTMSDYLQGRIAEVLVYDRALTASEHNQVGNYLAAKWGITWTDI